MMTLLADFYKQQLSSVNMEIEAITKLLLPFKHVNIYERKEM